MRMNPAPASAAPHVLVVDDQPEVRAMIAALLAEEGLRTTEAGSAEEAVRCVAARRFDAAVIDYVLPGTNGLLLLVQFRGLGNGRGLPVVLMSSLAPGKPRDAACENAARFACVGFLDKPVTGRRLFAALDTLLSLV